MRGGGGGRACAVIGVAEVWGWRNGHSTARDYGAQQNGRGDLAPTIWFA